MAVLDRLRLLDTRPDPEFDALVDLAAGFFDVKVALISLVDANRQWFKASHGLQASETPRAPSFCGHAIAGENVFLVPDAHADERFAQNPLVTGPPFVRFYAGAPLIFDAAAIGTLCILDSEPRSDINADACGDLRKFAQIAEELIEARTKRLQAA